ncbi:uncharacterized protein LOC142344284 [Convolutriloba macropyga]|uniref:uncharacterized protein LOC142344284 n=1 Tax=Convolutriloba macropyga TaxID=536237 RepID=UPI003F52798B
MANSAARKASRTETTPDKNFLEERVKYLEAEVKTLNKRLDTLRAAKNNTVIKATTKYVPSSEPKTHDGAAELARKQESEELRNLRLKVKELEGILAKERIMFKTELETFQKLKMEEQVQNTNCERHEALILSLQTENVQLQVQLAEREADSHYLTEDMTRHEAEWCEREEKYKKQLEDMSADNDKLRAILSRLTRELPQLQQTTDYLHSEITRANPNNR